MRLVGYSNPVADPVAGCLTIGAGTGFLPSLALPCPCLDYLAQKGVFLTTESLERAAISVRRRSLWPFGAGTVVSNRLESLLFAFYVESTAIQ
jgi:hypothetical protein